MNSNSTTTLRCHPLKKIGTLCQRKIKVCVFFTGTRAEYGHLYWLMKDLEQHESIQFQLLVSGAHLSPEFGLTYETIEKDGFHIDEKKWKCFYLPILPLALRKSVGLGCMGYAEALSRLAPDCVLILGDRYEALAAAQAAFFLRIPIAHLHGGEVTEGAYDDPIRHCITKLSTFHFVANSTYAKRVEQLGESRESIHSVGSVGLEHLTRTELMSIEELSEDLGFSLQEKQVFFCLHIIQRRCQLLM
ncbi:UDP-N-acetylglucosamine 2-epimerase [Vibrio sinaloensis]|nr:UDP-N-acetylglucosamine 2-epimerase [Vibrio sinaloensis]